jgi:glucosamine-6-phosphate deaminase
LRLLVEKDYAALSRAAARRIGAEIRNKPDMVLGLPTGDTPLGMYRELIRMHKEEGLDFSGVVTFNLDEYIGIPPENEHSFHAYMFQNFFHQINIKPENINIPEGISDDTARTCAEFDQKLNQKGGLDLLVLGIGHNGHIGFNEPGDAFIIKTHVTNLTRKTIAANSRFFAGRDEVPQQAVTMGLGGILGARKILLLASGDDKANIVTRLLESEAVSPQIPASFLLVHQHVTAIISEDAAKGLARARVPA